MNNQIYDQISSAYRRGFLGNPILSNMVRSRVSPTGPDAGMLYVEVRTACGVHLEVVPDRALDIPLLEYRGVPLSWLAPAGVFHPAHRAPTKKNLERTFYGGFLTTCGLTQAGMDCVDEGEYLPIHGRISTLPCSWHYAEERADSIVIRGAVREATLYEENLLLSREISIGKTKAEIAITDTIANEGHKAAPLMILYHINFGFPVVSAHTALESSFRSAEPFNSFAKKSRLRYSEFVEPTEGYPPDNYRFVDHAGPESPWVRLSNPHNGIAVLVRYDQTSLKHCTMWKTLAPKEYVVGIEPGNCLPEGRCAARENGRLQLIDPGESIRTHFTVVIEG
jgi:hypothetical protein